MSLDRVKEYLADNGYPPDLVEGGREGLIRRYREFVAQVEQGYKSGLEDYKNDLDLRMVISHAKAEDGEVRELDERLKKMLKASKRRLWETGPGKPFWDFGYPSNASGELLRNLQWEGLI
jgi:hypothetical protein